MNFNRGAKTIITLTFFNLIVKLMAFWWYLINSVLDFDNASEKYLSEMGDFTNLVVYMGTFFFIFTLWKTYKYLSGQEYFEAHSKCFQTIFNTAMIIYLI